MNKKLLLYGVAFGSACAALSFLYFSTAAYTKPMSLQLFFILSELIIIPVTAITLYFKSLKANLPEEFTMGRAVFHGFMLSVIISAAVSLLFSYLLQFRPELIAQILDFKFTKIKLQAVQLKKSQEEVNNMMANINYAYSSKGQFVNQLFLGASRGLFFSAIIAFIMKARINKN
ncbi:MAG: DUF4199 domain-containing protein [Bacteroidota bacterium]|nr:DUF4199 domain-containing protein [Bacteroidota bacterium]